MQFSQSEWRAKWCTVSCLWDLSGCPTLYCAQTSLCHSLCDQVSAQVQMSVIDLFALLSLWPSAFHLFLNSFQGFSLTQRFHPARLSSAFQICLSLPPLRQLMPPPLCVYKLNMLMFKSHGQSSETVQSFLLLR